jgi:DNA-binding NarL/FixJ family response regulator
MLKILIVDDHPVVRRGVRQILAEVPDIGSVGEAKDAAEAFHALQGDTWDAVVLDIMMPGKGGLETLKEMKHRYPGLPVLILSIYPEDQWALRVLKEGAAGYMNKECAPDELVGALRKIIRGGRYVSPALAEKLAFMIDAKQPVHEDLSSREYQVMVMLAEGKTLSQIADLLSLSVKTVSTYRSRILEKMDMENNAELIRYAIAHHLVLTP